MRLKCDSVVDGVGPSEKIVSITTTSGLEEVVVYSGLVEHNTLDVGPSLRRENNNVLVELPRESTSGRWRLWVPTSALAPG